MSTPAPPPDAAIDRVVPDEVALALRAILDGAMADSLEGQHLDFKEDPARAARPAGNPDARLAEIVLDTAICFANADGESHVILGVADRTAGPAAFTGTDADPDLLRRRIFDRTQPNLSVEIREFHVGEVRLLDIRVPQGLSVYSRKNMAASRREGTSCVPLTDDLRQQIGFERANPDLTARPTALSISDLDPGAIAHARRLLEQREPDRPAASDLDVLRRMGVIDGHGRLLRAAQVLLGRSEAHDVIARHLWRRAPGGEPSATGYRGPMLEAMAAMRDRVETLRDPEAARVELPTGQEAPIPNFPAQAIDESVSNAFIHRDWSSSLPIVVDQSPVALSVISPGGLPRGVDADRLLSTPSRPRNLVLMRALHTLGLAEETSRGFDRMWVSMLSSGRTPPTIDADDFQFAVTFTAGRADDEFVRWVAALSSHGFPREQVRSLSALSTLKHLESAPTISAQTASRLLQVGRDEAAAQLEWLSVVGLLAPAQDPREWQLSGTARDALGQVGGSAPLAGAIEQWILEAVDSQRAVSNRDVVRATGASGREVTSVLRYLADTHRIEKDPDGPARGVGVRWIQREG